MAGYTKEQIEEANGKDIVKVAEDLNMTLKRQGRTVMALCPWHEEQRPSMQVGGKQNTCHCFSCGATHGPIDLVMAKRGCGFKEAMEWLSPPIPRGGVRAKQKQNPSPPNPRGGIRAKQKQNPSPPNPRGGIREPGCNVKAQKEKPQMGSDPICHMGKRAVAKRDKKGLPPLGEGLGKGSEFASLADLQRFVSLQNALSKCLAYRFPMEVVTRVTWDYMLGVDYEVCHYDHTLFPSIDIEGRVHNVKSQGYVTCPTHERFGHSTKGQTYWVGQRLLPGQDCDTQCLFGEHLLRRYPNRVVVLVESPKNAVVGACKYPDLLWVATGNKGMLKRELLEVLRGRRVIVIPDRDAIDEWRQKIQGMQDIATLQLSTFCHCQEDEGNRKMDIADLILSK